MSVQKMQKVSDPLIIAGREFGSRLFLGTAGYSQPQADARCGRGERNPVVTASIRRISLAGDDESLVDLIPGTSISCPYRRLPDRQGRGAHRRAGARGARL